MPSFNYCTCRTVETGGCPGNCRRRPSISCSSSASTRRKSDQSSYHGATTSLVNSENRPQHLSLDNRNALMLCYNVPVPAGMIAKNVTIDITLRSVHSAPKDHQWNGTLPRDEAGKTRSFSSDKWNLRDKRLEALKSWSHDHNISQETIRIESENDGSSLKPQGSLQQTIITGSLQAQPKGLSGRVSETKQSSFGSPSPSASVQSSVSETPNPFMQAGILFRKKAAVLFFCVLLAFIIVNLSVSIIRFFGRPTSPSQIITEENIFEESDDGKENEGDRDLFFYD